MCPPSPHVTPDITGHRGPPWPSGVHTPAPAVLVSPCWRLKLRVPGRGVGGRGWSACGPRATLHGLLNSAGRVPLSSTSLRACHRLLCLNECMAVKAWFPPSGNCRTLEATGQVELQRLLVKVRGGRVRGGLRGAGTAPPAQRPQARVWFVPKYLLLKSIFSLFHIFLPLKTNNNVFGSLCLTNHHPYPRADCVAEPPPRPPVCGGHVWGTSQQRDPGLSLPHTPGLRLCLDHVPVTALRTHHAP